MRFLLVFFLCLLSSASFAETVSFPEWLTQMKADAVAQGVSETTVEEALGHVSLDDRVLELDQKQPEQAVTFDTYVNKTITPTRLKDGRKFLRQNLPLLRAVSNRYGVSPQFIVALLGIESSFGRGMGGFNVIAALTTLAYEGRRADFFRGELIEALHILDEEGLSPSELQGSWAGAMGQCQFMPSTYRRHAVDYDGDGRRDIWKDKGDVFASVSHYLTVEGWQAGQNWGREVKLTKPLPEEAIGLDHRENLTGWAELGVRVKNGKALPVSKLEASLIQPDGPHGRSFLVYDNFRALMRWNRSTYFATTVGLFADLLK